MDNVQQVDTAVTIAQPETAIITYEAGLGVLAGAIANKAQQNVENAIEETGGDFSTLEIYAMRVVEELRLINGLDLAAILMRGAKIKEIREQNLLATHPGHYANLQELAEKQGISLSELSDTIHLTDIVFPFMVATWGEGAVASMWDSLGKSKFREMTPILYAILTGERSKSAAVRDATEVALDNAAITFTAADQEVPDDATLRNVAAQLVLEGAELGTVRDMRNRLRPNRTPNIQAMYINDGDDAVFVAPVTADQRTMLSRLLGDHIDAQTVDAGDAPEYRELSRTTRRIVGA